MEIRNLKAGEEVSGFFAVRKKELKEYDSRFFLKLELGDASGRLDAVLWEDAATTNHQLEVGSVVKVKGTVTTYREDLQINVRNIRPAKQEEFSLDEILPRSKFSTEELEKRFVEEVRRVKNQHLKKLLELFMTDRPLGSARDKKIFDAYLEAPAGKLWHHNYIGGLAEHSLQMAEIARNVAPFYPQVDAELLVSGALLHDCGKVWQYRAVGFFDYTTEGRLVGHINSGDHYIASLAEKIENFPAELTWRLRHLILSHQGTGEQGSPIVPQTPEAFVLYAIDELDSKMGALARIWEKEKKAGWSEYIKLIDRYIYWGENRIQT